MVSDLVKLFDSFCEAIAKKDLNKMLSLFNEDATYTVYAQPYKPVSGKAALKPFMEDEFRKVDEYKVTKLFICENKGNLVVEWLVNYRDHNTGKRSWSRLLRRRRSRRRRSHKKSNGETSLKSHPRGANDS